MRISRRGESRYALVKFLVTVLVLAGVSFGAALVWQNAQDAILGAEAASLLEKASAPENAPPSAPAPAAQAVSSAPDAAARGPKPDTALSASGTEEISEAESGYARKALAGAVTETAAVGYSYFDDAIFFGDSISTGIPLYMQTLVPNAAVIATQGVSTVGVNTSECIDVNGTRVTMLEAAKAKGERSKVYVMLGANGLDYDEGPFIEGYRTFVRSIKELYPGATVYIQSMLPVTVNVNERYKSESINNPRIARLNEAILKMALEEGAYYVDVAQCMVNDDGFLPTEASPFDGMHLTAEYYVKWFDYLRSHTAEPINK